MNRNELQQYSKEITRRYLQMMQELTVDTVRDPIQPDPAVDTFCYFQILELQKRWITDETPLWELMSSLFVGMSAVAAPISTLFVCNGKTLRVCIGTQPAFVDVLEGMLQGVFPHIRIAKNDQGNSVLQSFRQLVPDPLRRFGGFLKGNPSGRESIDAPYQLDSVIKGMQGSPWHFTLFALPVSRAETIARQQQWMTEASLCSAFAELSISETDGRETMTNRRSFPHSEQFLNKVQSFLERLTASTALGEWRVTANFGSDSELRARLLGGLLTSAFFGKESEPELIHAVYFPSGQTAVPLCTDKMYQVIPQRSEFPTLTNSCPRYATYLSSRELGVLAAFPAIDTAGFAASDPVQFDVAREATGALSLGRILDGNRLTDTEYRIDPNELNRHCLVVGLTGSGKTNTVKSLIRSMTHSGKRPFLVIEPAKKEYWELYNLGYQDLQIYSVGSSEPGAHPFCLNPFERASYTDDALVRHHVPLQTHIDFVFSAFKASFIMYTPMPYVLEQAIYRIYEDCGWDVLRDRNRFGREIYPTLEDLYFKIPVIVTEMGYDARMRNDLIGSLQARIDSMRIGAKGATLNVQRSFPLDQILRHNVIIELEDIGDDDVKAFVISLLLISLLEIRRQQPDAQLQVRHLLLIEEAHRLLKNVQSGTGENADPRGAAVEFFCNLLAELRSKGQGFIVADQIPSKLAPDLIKNTNLKITHRTVALEERELIGGAMHMTEEQIEALASLRQGVAAVYSEGDNRPKLVKAPYAGGGVSGTPLSRAAVLQASGSRCVSVSDDPGYRIQTNRQSPLCRTCGAHCGGTPEDILTKLADPNAYSQLADRLNPQNQPNRNLNSGTLREGIRELLRTQLRDSELPPSCAELCVLQCLYQTWNSTENFRKKMTDIYIRNRNGE